MDMLLSFSSFFFFARRMEIPFYFSFSFLSFVLVGAWRFDGGISVGV
uniref:Uncharacterized protein n=1 Tax=Nelumbo nucifera TaxID=4432 RepID=A0A822XP63_NELNU|nr:TPA_asm: hypothetical protein HUJ06_024867 [Nelumbo nucifera]